MASRILAHRGWWKTPAEKNSQDAILRAFEAGLGVETDVRDCDGTLVLSHDPPRIGQTIDFEWVVETFASAGQPGTLAINIKADGLQSQLAPLLARHSVVRTFVFDMAVPDALGYFRTGMATYTRHSEMEPVPSFYERAHGVWMDCFEGDWIDGPAIAAHQKAGKTVALVSPELHGRDHRACWARWRDTPGIEAALICTDLPDEWLALR